MKLSFSTRGRLDLPWPALLETALEMRFSGIEIYNPQKTELLQKGGAFHPYQAMASLFYTRPLIMDILNVYNSYSQLRILTSTKQTGM